jgi:CBS domain-containing protein
MMTDALAQQSYEASPAPATVADVMRPPLTTIEHSAHAAAAAYVMKRAGATALTIRDGLTDQPVGIITEADIAHAVADGKDMNSVRIRDLMTTRPTVISANTTVRDAARVMTNSHFRHLPVVGDDSGLVGIVDITDVCRALIGPDPAAVRSLARCTGQAGPPSASPEPVG